MYTKMELIINIPIKVIVLKLWLQTFRILTNNVPMLILCLSYFITTVRSLKFEMRLQDSFASIIVKLLLQSPSRTKRWKPVLFMWNDMQTTFFFLMKKKIFPWHCTSFFFFYLKICAAFIHFLTSWWLLLPKMKQ